MVTTEFALFLRQTNPMVQENRHKSAAREQIARSARVAA
ncbi:hypothetical protein PCH70_50560 [Pseudomonas cichorii JBC1]|nr:hypothetical protein PCH70_50560 [Pseudomonas cichorii JBC1]